MPKPNTNHWPRALKLLHFKYFLGPHQPPNDIAPYRPGGAGAIKKIVSALEGLSRITLSEFYPKPGGGNGTRQVVNVVFPHARPGRVDPIFTTEFIGRLIQALAYQRASSVAARVQFRAVLTREGGDRARFKFTVDGTHPAPQDPMPLELGPEDDPALRADENGRVRPLPDAESPKEEGEAAAEGEEEEETEEEEAEGGEEGDEGDEGDEEEEEEDEEEEDDEEDEEEDEYQGPWDPSDPYQRPQMRHHDVQQPPIQHSQPHELSAAFSGGRRPPPQLPNFGGGAAPGRAWSHPTAFPPGAAPPVPTPHSLGMQTRQAAPMGAYTEQMHPATAMFLHHLGGVMAETRETIRQSRSAENAARESERAAYRQVLQMAMDGQQHTQARERAIQEGWNAHNQGMQMQLSALQNSIHWERRIMQVESEKKDVERETALQAQQQQGPGAFQNILGLIQMGGPIALAAFNRLMHYRSGAEGDPGPMIPPELLAMMGFGGPPPGMGGDPGGPPPGFVADEPPPGYVDPGAAPPPGYVDPNGGPPPGFVDPNPAAAPPGAVDPGFGPPPGHQPPPPGAQPEAAPPADGVPPGAVPTPEPTVEATPPPGSAPVPPAGHQPAPFPSTGAFVAPEPAPPNGANGGGHPVVNAPATSSPPLDFTQNERFDRAPIAMMCESLRRLTPEQTARSVALGRGAAAWRAVERISTLNHDEHGKDSIGALYRELCNSESMNALVGALPGEPSHLIMSIRMAIAQRHPDMAAEAHRQAYDPAWTPGDPWKREPVPQSSAPIVPGVVDVAAIPTPADPPRKIGSNFTNVAKKGGVVKKKKGKKKKKKKKKP